MSELEYIKDFDGWHPCKKQLNHDAKVPTFHRREIWWCATGVNIGVEQDGKNDLYERPVLIVRKFNKRLFWGIPLTTQNKDFPHHIVIEFKATKERQAKKRSFIISQMRAYDSKRLTRPLGKLTPTQFERIVEEIRQLL